MCVCVCVCVRTLSHFSHVQLAVTLWTIAHQPPLFMEFSRQEYLSGLPCPPPGDLPDPWVELTSLVSCIGVLLLQLCLTLCNPAGCSPPGSSDHGIFQARILEWVATSYSRGSSLPRGQTHIPVSPALADGFFTTVTTWEAQYFDYVVF